MKKLFSILLVILASFAAAQFEMGDMMRKMKTSPIALVMIPDIKKELKLKGEQGKKVDAIQKEYMKKMQEATKAGRNQQDMNSAISLTKSMDENIDSSSKALVEALDADQNKRLKEIRFQADGTDVLYDEETQKALGLSEEQVAKIKDWKSGEMNRMMEMMQNGQGRELQKKIKEMKKTEEETLMKFLTPEQKAKLKEMQGAPCKAAQRIKDAGF